MRKEDERRREREELRLEARVSGSRSDASGRVGIEQTTRPGLSSSI